MKKGAKAPEKVIFDRVIKKRKKRAGKKSSPKFKWTLAPKKEPVIVKKKGPSLFSKIKRLIGK